MASAPPPTEAVLEKKSRSSASVDNEKQTPPDGTEALVIDSPDDSESFRRPSPVRVVSLVALTLILGWWISSITIQATRHRWIVQTIFARAFLLIIASCFIPTLSSPALSRRCGSPSSQSPSVPLSALSSRTYVCDAPCFPTPFTDPQLVAFLKARTMVRSPSWVSSCSSLLSG